MYSTFDSIFLFALNMFRSFDKETKTKSTFFRRKLAIKKLYFIRNEPNKSREQTPRKVSHTTNCLVWKCFILWGPTSRRHWSENDKSQVSMFSYKLPGVFFDTKDVIWAWSLRLKYIYTSMSQASCAICVLFIKYHSCLKNWLIFRYPWHYFGYHFYFNHFGW